MKTLIPWLRHGALGGIAARQAMYIVLLLSGSSTPDPATGRIVAMIIAAEIAPSPTYVTALQAWLVAGLGVAGVLCALGWLVLAGFDRLGLLRPPAETPPAVLAAGFTSPRTRLRPGARRAFGRRGRVSPPG